MSAKWMGAILVIVGCGGVGMAMCANHRKAEQALEALLRSLEWMVWELRDRMPPLSVLCRDGARVGGGTAGKILMAFAEELDSQLTPDVQVCMEAVLARFERIPQPLGEQLRLLGEGLGCFDLAGQLSQLEAAANRCALTLENLRNGSNQRLRSYRAMAICAGIALAIVLI